MDRTLDERRQAERELVDKMFNPPGFVVDQLRGRIVWLPLIRNGDVLAITPWILIAAAGVAIVAGTIGIRRFLDV